LFIDSIHEALYDSDVPLTLVLDDLQHLSTSQRALAVVDHFLQSAPATTRVILSGRTVPRLRLQRLRLEDRLELIGHRDLAFTPEETADAVAASGLEMSQDASEALHRLTQGWPAGVRMAVLAMKAGGDQNLSLELRRDDALAEYLTTEVLASIDDELRRFLLEATIDDTVCPSLVSRRWAARSITARTSARPACTALSSSKAAWECSAISRASVVLPDPGGPYSTIECGRPCSIAPRSAEPSPSRCDCPTKSARLRGRMRTASGRASRPSRSAPPEALGSASNRLSIPRSIARVRVQAE